MSPLGSSRLSRRALIRSSLAGTLLFSGIVADLLAEDGNAAGQENVGNPHAPRQPHFAPKAKNVIFLFMSGGVSHVDTFDHKPQLKADHGKEVAIAHPEAMNRPGYEKLYLIPSRYEFTPRGQSGTLVSSIFPHLGDRVDDLAIIRSMHCDHSNHYNATLGMHTGSFNQARPSIGAWVNYGLGTFNQNLPAFVVLAPYTPYAGSQVWAADFLPGSHQGTLVLPGAEPMRNIRPRIELSRQSKELAALGAVNRKHLAERGPDASLEARLHSFETAAGMQLAAPEAFDFSQESAETHALYGLEPGSTQGFAWQCLAARRLVERGVRFVELIDTGSSNNWDSHGDMADHERLAKNVDQPIAGLLIDLKRRGLLEDTLVVWTTEFGRTPFNNKADAPGREHHPWAFTSWLAGGGAKAGTVYGATDEMGLRAEVDRVHVHDFHATILHLLGLDHQRLTYRHAGRDFRLTDVAGNVVHGVIS